MKILLRVLVGGGELKRIGGEGKKLPIHDGAGIVRETPDGIVPNGFVKRRLRGLRDQFERAGSEELDALRQVCQRRGFGISGDFRMGQAGDYIL